MEDGFVVVFAPVIAPSPSPPPERRGPSPSFVGDGTTPTAVMGRLTLNPEFKGSGRLFAPGTTQLLGKKRREFEAKVERLRRLGVPIERR